MLKSGSTILMTEDQHAAITEIASSTNKLKSKVVNALLYYGVTHYQMEDGLDLSKEKVIAYKVKVKPETLSYLMSFAANGRFKDVATTHKYILHYGLDLFSFSSDKESFLEQEPYRIVVSMGIKFVLPIM